MINIIIPIVENVEEFESFVKRIAGKNTKIFVGITESLAGKFKVDSKFVEVHVFSNKSNKEEIINSLHSCKLEKGKILIARRPLTDEEYLGISNSTKDIATLKARRSKLFNSIRDFGKSVVFRFFAFSYFEDISGICFGETMFNLLSVCQDLSTASRINRFVGVQVEEVETVTKPVKKDYSRLKNLCVLMLGILFFLGSVAGGVCTCIYGPLEALIVISVIAWILISIVVMMIAIVNFTRTTAVGQLRFGRAEEIL